MDAFFEGAELLCSILGNVTLTLALGLNYRTSLSGAYLWIVKKAYFTIFSCFCSNLTTKKHFMSLIYSIGMHKINKKQENLKIDFFIFLTPGLFEGSKNIFFSTTSTFFFSNPMVISYMYHYNMFVYQNNISEDFYSPPKCRL